MRNNRCNVCEKHRERSDEELQEQLHILGFFGAMGWLFLGFVLATLADSEAWRFMTPFFIVLGFVMCYVLLWLEGKIHDEVLPDA